MFQPRPPTPPSTGRTPSTLGRVLAIVAGLVLLGLGIGLYPTFRALNGAIVDSIEDRRSLVGLAVLLGFGLLGLLLLGLLGASVARAWHKAQQAAITKAPNGMPIHIRDVSAAKRRRDQDGLAAQLLAPTLQQHFAAQLAEAMRQYPQLHSLHTHSSNEYAGAQPAEPAAEQLPQLSSSGGGTLAQLHGIGHVCRSGNSLLAGYSDGQPQYIELADCGFIGIGGRPRVGKSTTTLLLIEQAILAGWHVFIGDPHIHKADGLLNRCRPFSGRLAKQASTPDEIAAMIRLADKIGRNRVNGDPDRTPVLLVVDEFSNLVWRKLLPEDVLAILPSMAAEYAGVGVHGVLIAHDWSKASLGGDLGAALRRAITHRLIHRMDPGNTEFLLPGGGAAQSRVINALERGRALFYGPDGGTLITVPWLAEDDGAYAAQGVAPRPYQPRPQLPAAPVSPGSNSQGSAGSHLPPTIPIAPRPAAAPVPPTLPIVITIPEQIADLLAARGGFMTVTEIAAALGLDLQVARTEVSALATAGQLQRRKCKGRTTRERYEYAAQPHKPINAINESTALSA